jgi:hypothetical protein
MGVVQPSNSDYASAVHLARKKNSEFRYCIDMRALNLQVQQDAYPLPTVTDLLD